jgi:hypothetical protein
MAETLPPAPINVVMVGKREFLDERALGIFAETLRMWNALDAADAELAAAHRDALIDALDKRSRDMLVTLCSSVSRAYPRSVA